MWWMRSAGCRKDSPTSCRLTTTSRTRPAIWDSAAASRCPVCAMRNTSTARAARGVRSRRRGRSRPAAQVFFSFNRFDATNPAPADELMASFPRLRVSCCRKSCSSRTNAGGFSQGKLARSVKDPGRVARFTRMVAAAPPRQRAVIPFSLEPDSLSARPGTRPWVRRLRPLGRAGCRRWCSRVGCALWLSILSRRRICS